MKDPWFQTRSAAGLLLLLLPLWGIAFRASATARTKPESQTHKPQSPVRGARDMADGQIKSVSCKGRALDMVFDAYDEILRLHTDDYFKVDFSALNFKPKGVMNPCKQAKGMYARVHFYRVKGHPHQGILTAVELRE